MRGGPFFFIFVRGGPFFFILVRLVRGGPKFCNKCAQLGFWSEKSVHCFDFGLKEVCTHNKKMWSATNQINLVLDGPKQINLVRHGAKFKKQVPPRTKLENLGPPRTKILFFGPAKNQIRKFGSARDQLKHFLSDTDQLRKPNFRTKMTVTYNNQLESFHMPLEWLHT